MGGASATLRWPRSYDRAQTRPPRALPRPPRTRFLPTFAFPPHPHLSSHGWSCFPGWGGFPVGLVGWFSRGSARLTPWGAHLRPSVCHLEQNPWLNPSFAPGSLDTTSPPVTHPPPFSPPTCTLLPAPQVRPKYHHDPPANRASENNSLCGMGCHRHAGSLRTGVGRHRRNQEGPLLGQERMPRTVYPVDLPKEYRRVLRYQSHGLPLPIREGLRYDEAPPPRNA